MEIKQFNLEEHGKKVAALWNEVVEERGFYKPFTEQEFFERLFYNRQFDSEGAFIALDKDLVVGFSCGMIRAQDMDNPNAPGYPNTIIVKKAYRNQGIGNKLLTKVEEYFVAKGHKASRCVFLSPVNWPWYIPNTDHHDHPGVPAVPVNSPEYFFYLHNGYMIEGQCDAFHLPLAEYKMNDDVLQKIKINEAKGFKIETYKEGYHYGFEEFYKNIQNEGFERAIRYNLNKEKPNPFLVVSENGKVVGWTGAMYTEPSGRAHFDGITVDPNVRGAGLGKSLFCSLALYSKEHGSKFMTFFTGLENPARYIYMYAGFKIIQSFAILKKELK